MEAQKIVVVFREKNWETISGILHSVCQSRDNTWIQWANSINQIILKSMQSFPPSSNSNARISIALVESNWKAVISILEIGTHNRGEAWMHWSNAIIATIQNSIESVKKATPQYQINSPRAKVSSPALTSSQNPGADTSLGDFIRGLLAGFFYSLILTPLAGVIWGAEHMLSGNTEKDKRRGTAGCGSICGAFAVFIIYVIITVIVISNH